MHPIHRCKCGNPKSREAIACGECARSYAEVLAPTEEEIAERAAAIRAGWSEEETRKRSMGIVRGGVEIPLIPLVEFVSAAHNGYLREA